MKKNWQFKRAVNITFYKLRKLPRLARLFVRLTYLLRYFLRAGMAPKADNIGTVIICDELKAIHAGNPKVASSSVRSFFRTLPFSYQLETKLSYADVLKTNAKLSDYYQFAFVRDPWSRVYSCWNDKISNNGKFADIFIITRYRGLYPDMPFAEFVHWLASEEGADQLSDRHWISQYRILNNNEGGLRFDSLGYMSSLKEDFAKIQSELGIESFSLPHSNQQQNENSFLNAYTDELLAIVSERYQRDITVFGFKVPQL